MAADRGVLSVRAKIKVRLTQLRPPVEIEAELFGHSGWQPGDAWMAETTLGRVMFNELLPLGYPFVNKQMHKKVQAAIINDLAERYPMIVVAQTVDKLKDAGFYWATRSGVTVSMATCWCRRARRRSSTTTRSARTRSKSSSSVAL